ncbi:MAG: nucleotidyltransferase domain-containing protein, partial [Candidatus Margulisiibacteriota bacterium]
MTADEYLSLLITKYKASTGPGSTSYNAANAVYPIIQQWAGTQLRKVSFSGSNAKGTAIKGATDVDLFISLKSDTKESLRQIFDSLYNYFYKRGYIGARKQNVSIHIAHAGVDIDLVPAVHFGGNTEDHWLHVNSADQERIKTNINTHIELIRKSG